MKCSVKVNHHFTQWFDVSVGLKQGCVLSTTLFNIYINDLSELLDQCQRGFLIDNKIISHLFYADDLVLMAESEEDLQVPLDILATWCISNKMNINTDKTKIMHFRTPSIVRTDYIFTCGESQIEIVDKYRYLGILLNDTLDYDITAKYITQSATRALGLLISKFRAAGGMPFDVFTKLYDTMVWPIISYGAALWGTRDFSSTNAVQNRACFYMGWGKYAPNAKVNGDMG